MLRFLRYVILIPIAVALIAFAIANHELVRLSLDPFTNFDNAAYSVPAPMFVVLVATVAIGVILGGVTVWLGQGKYRRAARQLRVENEKLKANLQALEPKGPPRLVKRA